MCIVHSTLICYQSFRYEEVHMMISNLNLFKFMIIVMIMYQYIAESQKDYWCVYLYYVNSLCFQRVIFMSITQKILQYFNNQEYNFKNQLLFHSEDILKMNKNKAGAAERQKYARPAALLISFEYIRLEKYTFIQVDIITSI